MGVHLSVCLRLSSDSRSEGLREGDRAPRFTRGRRTAQWLAGDPGLGGRHAPLRLRPKQIPRAPSRCSCAWLFSPRTAWPSPPRCSVHGRVSCCRGTRRPARASVSAPWHLAIPTFCSAGRAATWMRAFWLAHCPPFPWVAAEAGRCWLTADQRSEPVLCHRSRRGTLGNLRCRVEHVCSCVTTITKNTTPLQRCELAW